MAFANGKAIHGFRHGMAPDGVQSDFWWSQVGSPSLVAAAGREGRNVIQISPSAATEYLQMHYAQNSTAGQANTDRIVLSLYFRYITKPTSSANLISNVMSGGGVLLNTTTGYLDLKYDNGTAVSTGVNPTLNEWYRLDGIWRGDLDPHTMQVMITADGDPTKLFEGSATRQAGAAYAGKWFSLGQYSGTTTQTIQFCDVLASGHAAASADGDYPITPEGYHHRVLAYVPAGDGTHSVGSATFRYTDNNGGAYTTITNGTTTSYLRIYDWPHAADGAANDDWVEKSGGTTLADRVEWTFAQESGSPGTPIGVHTHAAVRNDSGTGSNLSLYQREGTTDAASLICTGDPGASTTVYRGWCYPKRPDGTSAWDVTSVNAAKVRFSSSDVAPVPRVKAVHIEVAYQYAAGQTLLPDADNATGGWTTAPLYSKLNDSSDATYITATAS